MFWAMFWLVRLDLVCLSYDSCTKIHGYVGMQCDVAAFVPRQAYDYVYYTVLLRWLTVELWCSFISTFHSVLPGSQKEQYIKWMFWGQCSFSSLFISTSSITSWVARTSCVSSWNTFNPMIMQRELGLLSWLLSVHCGHVLLVKLWHTMVVLFWLYVCARASDPSYLYLILTPPR